MQTMQNLVIQDMEEEGRFAELSHWMIEPSQIEMSTSPIGRGATSEVYKAWYHDRACVCKVRTLQKMNIFCDICVT